MRPQVYRRTGFLLSVLLVGLLICSTTEARPSHLKLEMVANAKLADWAPVTQESPLDGTVAFLLDDRVVVSVCQIRGDFHCLRLVVLQIANSQFRALSKNDHPRPFGSLRRTQAEGVLVYPSPWLGFPIELLSAELTTTLRIPFNVKLSASARTTGSNGPNNSWSISRVCPCLDCIEQIRNGSGKLQAISDDQIAVLNNNRVSIESIQGKEVGGFRVQPNCATELEFAGKGRIYLKSCGPERIVDANGKELVRLRPPVKGDLSFRSWSEEGARLLYDQSVRSVSALQNFGEAVVAVLSLGSGAINEVPNGEAVRVVDTLTGQTCFDWRDLKHVANVGDYPHAALSPSGKFVALVAEGELRVYRLPDVCSAK